MSSDPIESLDSIKSHFHIQQNPNIAHKQQLSPLEKLAVIVTDKIGTMGFFFIILIWTILWLGWNIIAPQNLRFDPFPAFVLWLFISNLIQIHLMPLIMVGQNIQGKHAEIRAEHDFQTDRKAEKEIETILLRLEKQEEILLSLQAKIDQLQKSN